MNKSEQLIACLEGEIAKRDARIMGLESQYQRDVYGLNNEGDPIGGDPAGGYANDNARLRAELAAIKAQEPLTVEFMQFMTAVVTGAGLLSRGKQSKGLASELSATAYKYMLGAQVSGYQQKPIGYRCWFNKEPKNIMVEWGKSLPSDMNPSATYQALYATPVSEAKAQGVALDGSQLAGLLEQVRLDDDEAKPHGSGAAYWNNAVIACQVAIRDALAAPVQQVSVPGGHVLVDKKALGAVLQALVNAPHHIRELQVTRTPVELFSDNPINVLIANYEAPAAPAADAGLGEALELAANRLDRLALEQGEFWRGYATTWADEARATANGVKS